MRKLALTICIAIMGFQAFGQEAKFYTDNGSREVTELEVGMSDIKVVVPIPDEIGNHELVEIAIDYIVDGEYQDGNFRHVKEYKTAYLNTKDEVSLWIKAPGQSEGDFCILGSEYCFGIDDPLKFENREYTSSKVEVRVLGKDVNGYRWSGNKQVPTYKFSTLSSHYINMDYGELDAILESEDGKLRVPRFEGEQKIEKISSEGDLSIFYSSIGSATEDGPGRINSVVFSIKTMEDGAEPAAGGDMGGGGPPKKSEGSTAETLKKSVVYTLLYGSNSYDAQRYVDGIAPSFAWYHWFNDSENDHYYEPMAMGAKEEKSGGLNLKKLAGFSNPQKLKKDYNDFVLDKINILDWKTGKVGNLDCDILDIQVYNKDQVFTEGDPEMKKVKPSEIGNSKRLLLFVGEKNGQVIYGWIFKGGSEPLTEEEQKFWDYMLASVEAA